MQPASSLSWRKKGCSKSKTEIGKAVYSSLSATSLAGDCRQPVEAVDLAHAHAGDRIDPKILGDHFNDPTKRRIEDVKEFMEDRPNVDLFSAFGLSSLSRSDEHSHSFGGLLKDSGGISFSPSPSCEMPRVSSDSPLASARLREDGRGAKSEAMSRVLSRESRSRLRRDRSRHSGLTAIDSITVKSKRKPLIAVTDTDSESSSESSDCSRKLQRDVSFAVDTGDEDAADCEPMRLDTVGEEIADCAKSRKRKRVGDSVVVGESGPGFDCCDWRELSGVRDVEGGGGGERDHPQLRHSGDSDNSDDGIAAMAGSGVELMHALSHASNQLATGGALAVLTAADLRLAKRRLENMLNAVNAQIRKRTMPKLKRWKKWEIDDICKWLSLICDMHFSKRYDIDNAIKRKLLKYGIESGRDLQYLSRSELQDIGIGHIRDRALLFEQLQKLLRTTASKHSDHSSASGSVVQRKDDSCLVAETLLSARTDALSIDSAEPGAMPKPSPFAGRSTALELLPAAERKEYCVAKEKPSLILDGTELVETSGEKRNSYRTWK